MSKIYIYGRGGHSKVVADIAVSCGYSELIFLDDKGEMKFDPDLEKHDIIIAIGDSKTREILQHRVKDCGFKLANLIHPTAFISSSAILKEGIVVMPNAVINANVHINSGVIVNSSAVVEHDCCIGEFSHICPKVALAGYVSIGKRSWIGIGSCVVHGLKIKDDIMIGAGSVVVKDILVGSKAYGNPCKVVY